MDQINKEDTISRKAAMDLVKDVCEAILSGCGSHYNGEVEVYDDLREAYAILKCNKEIRVALRHMPSAQPEPQWIPVTKKAHPDLPIRVQVQMDNGWIITAYYQEGEWLSVPDCGAPLRDKWIEAWRELPEPYAERQRK